MGAPLFPGGVAISDLQVYDWEAVDGCRGGSPHLHTASSEGYVVTGGSGAVHTLSSAGAEQHPLAPGDVVWFSPGTVHRLVNDGDLHLLVVMSNAGLPEAGDAVLTFPARILDDPEAYRAAAILPSGDGSADAGRVDAGRADAARARRDLAMQGYLELAAAIDRDGQDALRAFHERAARIVQPRVAGWQDRWERSVATETERTRDRLAGLAVGDARLLAEASVSRAEPTGADRAYGMCGRLRTWDWPFADGADGSRRMIRPSAARRTADCR
ncbi:cupin domain-containing protein [Agromyces sp. LHK192]|uniref:cupin domain-containing protein n=1 Tax=Agromyces sp. LHK192 TaxID=2498704 RepID=UPI000FDC9F12|nr:cupin domain-containing protein [Agromyces sp. LHK192]